MPQTFTIANQGSLIVPEEIAELEIKMWAAGGGGESVADDLTKTPGTDGGDSEFFGLKATGGGGGSTPGGGNAGSAQSVFNWANFGVTVGAFGGNNGGIPTAGNGATIAGQRRGDGGGGDPGQQTFVSNVTHIFNNNSNTHIFYDSSPDLQVTFNGQYAPDGLSCGPNYGTKHYQITFYQLFQNQFWNLALNSVVQQAAGGGTNSPYFSCGTLDKTASGFRIWFGNANSKNTYVRGFTFTASGLKAGGQGMGGGGGGGITASFTRQQLIDSIIYAPGTTHVATVGTVGTGYTLGGPGYLEVSMLIRPKVILDVSDTVLIIGQCTQLSWETTGDGDTLYWLAGNISNLNLTSAVSICPQITTTYSVQATGLGGTSAIATQTVYVVYVPTATISGPTEIDYGDTLNIAYETQYADTEIKLTPFYQMTDGTSFEGSSILITPAVTGESGRPDGETIVNGNVDIPVPWGPTGPAQIEVRITATGTGGSVSPTTGFIPVNIDITPDNINIPETDDAFKDQDPIVTPDTDILTNLILIDGIDIPITVKSNAQIKIDINQGDDWQSVEQI